MWILVATRTSKCLEWLLVQDVGWLVVGMTWKIGEIRPCQVKELGFEQRGNEEPLEAGVGMSDLLEMLKFKKSKVKFEWVSNVIVIFPSKSIKLIKSECLSSL